MPPPLRTLPRFGPDPAQNGRFVTDALAGVRGDIASETAAREAGFAALDATTVPYTPGNPAAWVAPPPTTVQQALDRLAAAGGTTPVP